VGEKIVRVCFMQTWPLCYRGLFNMPSETPYALRCIGDPEVITNSVLYKSDWYISCNLCHTQWRLHW